MGGNKFISEQEEPEVVEEKVVEKKEPPKRKPRPTPKALSFLNVFGIFEEKQIVRLMPFILFMTFLALVYIGNSYYAERTVRKIDKVKTELKEKRAEFISTRSELMFRTKQSEVAKAIAPMEIKESVEPQKKIVVSSEEKK